MMMYGKHKKGYDKEMMSDKEKKEAWKDRLARFKERRKAKGKPSASYNRMKKRLKSRAKESKKS